MRAKELIPHSFNMVRNKLAPKKSTNNRYGDLKKSSPVTESDFFTFQPLQNKVEPSTSINQASPYTNNFTIGISPI